MKIDRLTLGTAQFGMDYGVNNKLGKLSHGDALQILDKAYNSGIRTIDTAYAYGDSENIIGEFINRCNNSLKIISKLSLDSNKSAKQIVNISLKRLNLTMIYGYLMHNFGLYSQNPSVWKELEALKQNKKIEKIGFSLYYPSELETLFKHNLKIDIVQVPFNIFDRRFEPYFEEIKKREIELYARSVFLQGLVFKDLRMLDDFFTPIKKALRDLKLLSEELNTSILNLCINFVLKNNFVDKVVVGVDSVAHLDEIIDVIGNYSFDENIISRLERLKVEDEGVLLPFRWPRSLHKI